MGSLDATSGLIRSTCIHSPSASRPVQKQQRLMWLQRGRREERASESECESQASEIKRASEQGDEIWKWIRLDNSD